MCESILSVGIDIGTSTTQLVFSRLTIKNTSSAFSIPKITITDRTIIYKSSVHFTPLLTPDEIDAIKVCAIIRLEYEKAGILPAEVATGAVIITGDTARKKNAASILSLLSGLAGEFVVTTAGPDLESVLSGKGAGADLISKQENITLANFDIGGGTTNISVFKKGELLATACLDIGGRLIKMEEGKISYIYRKIQTLAANNGITLLVGDTPDAEKMRSVAALMVMVLEQSLCLRNKDAALRQLFTATEKDLQTVLPLDAITFSGGVANFIYQDCPDVFPYGDIGAILGSELKKSALCQKFRLLRPLETIRATVVGASSYTTEVSGSTICYDLDFLPLKNIPILKLSAEEETSQKLAAAIKEKALFYKTLDGFETFALALTGKDFFHFAEIQTLADLLLSGMKEALAPNLPLIVILEKDIAQALGNALRAKAPHLPLICLDSITTALGDYIDIGLPAGGGRVLPVVIKTLIFNH